MLWKNILLNKYEKDENFREFGIGIRSFKYLVFFMILGIFLSLNAFFYGESSTVFADTEFEDLRCNEYIKVGIFYGSSSAKSWEAFFDGGIEIGQIVDNKFERVDRFENIEKVKIQLVGSEIYIIGTDENGEIVEISDMYENIDAIMPLGFPDTQGFVISDRPYRGGLVFNGLQKRRGVQ